MGRLVMRSDKQGNRARRGRFDAVTLLVSDRSPRLCSLLNLIHIRRARRINNSRAEKASFPIGAFYFRWALKTCGINTIVEYNCPATINAILRCSHAANRCVFRMNQLNEQKGIALCQDNFFFFFFEKPSVAFPFDRSRNSNFFTIIHCSHF